MNNYRYENTNGGIYCQKHIGCSAQAIIESNPTIESFDTDLTSWFRMTDAEVAEFATFINNDETCEDCRHSLVSAK